LTWGKTSERALLYTEKPRPLADYGSSGNALIVTSDVLDAAQFFFIRLQLPYAQE